MPPSSRLPRAVSSIEMSLGLSWHSSSGIRPWIRETSPFADIDAPYTSDSCKERIQLIEMCLHSRNWYYETYQYIFLSHYSPPLDFQSLPGTCPCPFELKLGFIIAPVDALAREGASHQMYSALTLELCNNISLALNDFEYYSVDIW